MVNFSTVSITKLNQNNIPDKRGCLVDLIFFLALKLEKYSQSVITVYIKDIAIILLCLITFLYPQ